MKNLLPLFACLVFASPCLAQTARSSYIIVTTETKWADGMTDVVGEVEECLGETAAGYVVSADGHTYTLPKANARVITSDEAAKRLLSQRAQLYASIEKLEGASAQKNAPPTQYNGRPLPPNWIDPKEADARFQAQQLQDRLQAAEQAAQQAQQGRRFP